MNQALCIVLAHLLAALPAGTSLWTKGKRKIIPHATQSATDLRGSVLHHKK